VEARGSTCATCQARAVQYMLQPTQFKERLFTITKTKVDGSHPQQSIPLRKDSWRGVGIRESLIVKRITSLSHNILQLLLILYVGLGSHKKFLSAYREFVDRQTANQISSSERQWPS